jgi:hypothetical protein
MNKIFGLLLISIVFFSCKEEASGPCDYHNYEGLAKVKSIDPYNKDGKQLFHIALKFNTSSLAKETQYLGKLKDIDIDSTFLAKNRIKVGFNYQVLVSEIKDEGNCTPMFVSFDHNFK